MYEYEQHQLFAPLIARETIEKKGENISAADSALTLDRQAHICYTIGVQIVVIIRFRIMSVGLVTVGQQKAPAFCNTAYCFTL